MATWTVWKEGEYSNQMLGKQFHDASEGIITSFGNISKISGERGVGGGGGVPRANRLEKSVSVRRKRPSLSLFSQESRFLEDCLSLKALTSLLFSSRLLVLCKKPVAQEAGSEEGQRTPSLTGLAAGPG